MNPNLHAVNLHEKLPGISIVIIEDDETIRIGYTYLLNKQPGFTVINSYASAEAALKILSRMQQMFFSWIFRLLV